MLHGIVFWYNVPGCLAVAGHPRVRGHSGVKVNGRPEVKDKGQLEFKVKGHLGVKVKSCLKVRVKGHSRVNVKGHPGSKSKVNQGQSQRSLRGSSLTPSLTSHSSHLPNPRPLDDPWVNFDFDLWMTPTPG